MKRVDDFRLKFGKKELVPIMVGGMGVDISTASHCWHIMVCYLWALSLQVHPLVDSSTP